VKPILADQHLPIPAPGRVVVTRATTAKSFSNSRERAVMLLKSPGPGIIKSALIKSGADHCLVSCHCTFVRQNVREISRTRQLEVEQGRRVELEHIQAL
jgi:hypothetical protein